MFLYNDSVLFGFGADDRIETMYITFYWIFFGSEHVAFVTFLSDEFFNTFHILVSFGSLITWYLGCLNVINIFSINIHILCDKSGTWVTVVLRVIYSNPRNVFPVEPLSLKRPVIFPIFQHAFGCRWYFYLYDACSQYSGSVKLSFLNILDTVCSDRTRRKLSINIKICPPFLIPGWTYIWI